MEQEQSGPRAEQAPKLEVIRQLSPTLYELSDGRFVVVGTDASAALDPHLPKDAGRADYERTVVIPRETLIDAKRHIPDE